MKKYYLIVGVIVFFILSGFGSFGFYEDTSTFPWDSWVKDRTVQIQKQNEAKKAEKIAKLRADVTEAMTDLQTAWEKKESKVKLIQKVERARQLVGKLILIGGESKWIDCWAELTKFRNALVEEE